ncbi:MAG: ABC transporter substrate-binding protein [Ramlibacter sp.]|nr:ABC transporter substrate-binding protein [Ramlibacter sp.]
MTRPLPRGARGRRQYVKALAALPLLGFGSAGAQERPLRLLTGFPPGASLDTVARVFAEELKNELGRPVIVESKAGASGRIANETLKSAQPDGNMLLLAPVATLSIFPHAFGGTLRYDPFRDFAPVAHVARFPIGFAVGKSVPAETLAEYAALAKRDPAARNYGSSAAGSISHFLGLMFARSAGVDLVHVPYRGAAFAMNALTAGEIAAVAVSASDIAPLAASGNARLLATAGRQRSPAFPQVPTFREAGYNIEGEGAYALFLPAGAAPELVSRVSAAALRALRQPPLRRKLETSGLEPTGFGPTQLAAIVKSDYDHWGPTVRASGFVLND